MSKGVWGAMEFRYMIPLYSGQQGVVVKGCEVDGRMASMSCRSGANTWCKYKLR